VRAELISVGTELLLGQILNTNVQFLAQELASLGINVYFQTTVGDNRGRLLQALQNATDRADLIILTGGLGPTEDDLTKEILAEFLQLPLAVVPEELAKLQKLFQRNNLRWTDNNAKQAAFIPGSVILNNDCGTAPGMAILNRGKGYLVFPGPPAELKQMFSRYAVPWLKECFSAEIKESLYSIVLKFTGITESGLENLLADLFHAQKEITLALYVKPGEIQLRVTGKAASQTKFEEKAAALLTEIRERTVGFLFAEAGETLTEVVAKLLQQKQLTISTAESCTGGMLAAQLTSIPGSSTYFTGSIVAYNNSIKAKLLGVPQELLTKFGAVSKEVGTAMAEGIRKLTGSAIGVGITGIAGPGGGSTEKPVGLVYIALATPEYTICQEHHCNGDRERIRHRTVSKAQYILWRYLKNYANEENKMG
jgi:nicotinamide-nucleotide amidase